MCIDCLNINLEGINEEGDYLRERLGNITCECCKSYPKFLLSVNNDLKMLCLTKIKKHGQVCRNGFFKLTIMEMRLKGEIKSKLHSCLEDIEEQKCDILENTYLEKMNELKKLNDTIDTLDENS